MKKIISKILIIFIVLIILFEFIYSSNVSYALETETINSITNLIGGLVSLILWIPRLLVTWMAWLCGDIMTEGFAKSCGVSDAPIFAGTENNMATPFDIFFNKYKFFDVNFFDITEGGTTVIDTIRTTVAQWFYTLRTVSAAVLLCVLIYVGIRMALSTIADDKAKYKKMLIDWISSLALIFVLQYLAIFTIYANEAIVNFLREANFEDIGAAMEIFSDQATTGMGIGGLVSTFVYCMISFQTISFMIAYMQRMLKTGFLIMISPLISITYSIDKIGDGKAQALNSWLKEFVYTILIQPFHCVMYLAFANTAVKLVNTAPSVNQSLIGALAALADGKFNQLANGFLIILCFKFINDGEKAIRKIFNFQDDGNMTSMAAGAAIGIAALSNAKKIGSTTAKGFNTVRSLPTKFGSAVAKDRKSGVFNKIGQDMSKVFNKVDKTGQLSKAAKAIGTTADTLKNNKFINGTQNAMKVIGGKAAGYKAKADNLKQNAGKWLAAHPKLQNGLKGAKTLGGGALKRSMPLALGMMGAAMSYATGTSGAMEAIGVGSGLSSGSEQFFESTQDNLESNATDYSKDVVNNAIAESEECKKLQSETQENASKLSQATRSLKTANAGIKGLTEYQKAQSDTVKSIENQRASLEARKASGNISEEDFKSQMAELNKQKKDLIDGANGEEGIGKSAYDLLALKHNSERTISTQEGLQRELDDKRFKTAAAAFLNFKNAGHAGNVEQAKQDILKILLKLQLANKEKSNDGSEVDSDSSYQLTMDDSDSAERMQKSLCDRLDRSLMGAGAQFDTGQYIKETFGADSSPIAQEMQSAIETYQYYKSGQLYNDTRNNANSLGVDKTKFDSDCFRKITGYGGYSDEVAKAAQEESSGANG